VNKVRSEAMWRLGSQAARKPVNAAAAKIQSEKNNGNEKKGECTKTERMEHMMLTSNRATATWGERTNANRASVTLVFLCVDFTRKQYRNLEILDMHSFAVPQREAKANRNLGYPLHPSSQKSRIIAVRPSQGFMLEMYCKSQTDMTG